MYTKKDVHHFLQTKMMMHDDARTSVWIGIKCETSVHVCEIKFSLLVCMLNYKPFRAFGWTMKWIRFLIISPKALVQILYMYFMSELDSLFHIGISTSLEPTNCAENTSSFNALLQDDSFSSFSLRSCGLCITLMNLPHLETSK